jgi:glucokinase
MKLGIDIGGTKCAVILGDSSGIVKKIRFATTSYEETMENIRKAVREMGAFDAIGISCGGPLNSKTGVILSPPNLPGWDDVHITEMLSAEFGVPAYLCNDADACALAEWKFGAGKGTENMIFLTFGTGMGAGLILNGKLYSGTNGMAGEVGHMRMNEFGPVGYGKTGSFEGFCSGGGLAQIGKTLAREQLQMGKKLPYCRTLAELDHITAKSLAEYANMGDETALEAYRICGEVLGRGLAVLVDILNPERIVIGSVFARAESLLRPHMEKTLKREALSFSYETCKVVPAALGDSIGDYAALAVAENH